MSGALKRFSHSRVSNELLTYFAHLTMKHAVKIPDNLFINKQSEKIQQLLKEMEEAFQRVLKNQYTEGIGLLDIRRDKLLIALRATLSSAVSLEIIAPEKAKAAKAILVHLETMDERVISLGYFEESVEIHSFLTAVAKLGESVLVLSTAAPIVEALAETQAEFDKLYEDKTAADNQVSTPRTLRNIRKDLVFRLEALLNVIDVNGIDYEDIYRETVNSINNLIDEVMAKAKAEETRKESADA